jgi:hypothetical protein
MQKTKLKQEFHERQVRYCIVFLCVVVVVVVTFSTRSPWYTVVKAVLTLIQWQP